MGAAASIVGAEDPRVVELVKEYEANMHLPPSSLCRHLMSVLAARDTQRDVFAEVSDTTVGVLNAAADAGEVTDQNMMKDSDDGDGDDDNEDDDESGDEDEEDDEDKDVADDDSADDEDDDQAESSVDDDADDIKLRAKLRDELNQRVQKHGSPAAAAGSGAAAAAALSPTRLPMRSPVRARPGGSGAFRVNREPRDHIESEQAKLMQKQEQKRRRELAQQQYKAEQEAKKQAIKDRALRRKAKHDAKMAKMQREREQRKNERAARAQGDGRHGAAAIPFQRCLQQPHYLDNISNPAKELVLPGSTVGVDGAMVRRRFSLAEEDKAPSAALSLLKRKSPTKRQQRKMQQAGRSPTLKASSSSTGISKVSGSTEAANSPSAGTGLRTSASAEAIAATPTIAAEGDAFGDMWSSASQTGLGELVGDKNFKGWKRKGGKLADSLGRPVDPTCRRRIPHKCGPNCPYRRGTTQNTPKKMRVKKARPRPIATTDTDAVDFGEKAYPDEGMGVSGDGDVKEPSAARPVWIDQVDPDSGSVYYLNTETNETTWDKPADFVASAQ